MGRTEQQTPTLQRELSRAAIALLQADHADGVHAGVLDFDCPHCLADLVAGRVSAAAGEETGQPSQR